MNYKYDINTSVFNSSIIAYKLKLQMMKSNKLNINLGQSLFRFSLVLLLTASSLNNMVAQCYWNNKGFDEYTSCPDNLNQVSRAKDWFNGTVNGTPDYFYASAPCNFAEYTQVPDVLTPPLANNASCAGWGLLNCQAGVNGYMGLYLNSSTGGGLYKEYIAKQFSIASGSSYTLILNTAISTSSYTGSIATDLVVYGVPCPANFPLTNNPVTYNPTTAGLVALGTITKDVLIASSSGQWGTNLISFTASANFCGILIGPPISSTPYTQDGYIFLDNLLMIGAALPEANAGPDLRFCPAPGSIILQADSFLNIQTQNEV